MPTAMMTILGPLFFIYMKIETGYLICFYCWSLNKTNHLSKNIIIKLKKKVADASL